MRYRRRKGALALLEGLADDVAGWPARAVEFYRLLGWAQALNHLRPALGRTVDLRHGDALDRLDGPFDELAHTVDLRRINSHRTPGRCNVPHVGLFVWRLRAYPVTQTPAYCLEEVGPHCFTFSILGNDTPLYTRPEPEPGPTHIAGQMNLPVPIRRRALERRKDDYYGQGRSLQIWRGTEDGDAPQLVLAQNVVVADLSDWQYLPRQGKAAVDPALGRIAFHPRELPKHGVWVSYTYGFSADIGGGVYDRPLQQEGDAVVYRVSGRDQLQKALEPWSRENLLGSQPPRAVVEITDDGVYVQPINLILQEGHSLQLRAAERVRPTIRLLDWQTDRPDALSVDLAPGSRFVLDGLLVAGRGVQVRDRQVGDEPEGRAGARGQPGSVLIRHTTLVPGWALHPDLEPRRPAEPSLELIDSRASVTIQHSILGSIQVNLGQVEWDPVPIRVIDSVLDATRLENEALGASGWPLAHAVLTVVRSTVFGQVQTHAIELAENSIFMGRIRVGRRQRGCLRFCYVTPGSHTPRRYQCQPDLVEKPIKEQFNRAEILADERDRAMAREQSRARPQFNSTRYGAPTYCQLAETCAEEIKRGADDRSEMGVFHDLYQPQREANLRARLDEYTPAGMEAGIIYAS